MNSQKELKLERPVRPDPEIIARKILDFGRLLSSQLEKSTPPLNGDFAQAINTAQDDLMQALYDCNLRGLQTALDYNNKGRNIDELLLRVVAVVSYQVLAWSKSVEVKGVTQAATLGRDLCQQLRIRQVIFRLCVRRILVLDEYRGHESITLGQPLLDFFRGPDEPLILTQDAIRKVWSQQEATEKRRQAGLKEGQLPSAKWIYEQLSRFVTGQHELKMALAVAGRQTLLRREAKLLNRRGCLPPKPNVCIVGASGTGKSYACSVLSKILCLPFASYDCSSVTASGYVGDDLSGCLYLLAQSAARMGVAPEDGGLIHLDEIDKISTTSYDSATTTGVQFEALRLLDGTEVSYPLNGLNKWGGGGGTMDTSSLLVVCSGAFSWLADDLTGCKPQLGFDQNACSGDALNLRELLTSRGGLVPEIVNRFASIVKMDLLTPDNIADIMLCEHGPLGDYRATLKAEGRTLSLDRDAALVVGQWSVETGLLGRGPKAALEQLLRNTLFEGSPKEVIITADTVRQKLGSLPS